MWKICSSSSIKRNKLASRKFGEGKEFAWLRDGKSSQISRMRVWFIYTDHPVPPKKHGNINGINPRSH
jgi:hypothetical protein